MKQSVRYIRTKLQQYVAQVPWLCEEDIDSITDEQCLQIADEVQKYLQEKKFQELTAQTSRVSG